MNKSSKIALQQSKLILEELEERRLFSGGIEGLIVSDLDSEANAIYRDVDAQSSRTEKINGDSDTAEQQSREIVFVDAGVDNYQQLVDDLLANTDSSRNIEVVVLDQDKDGIEEISEFLADRDDLDAIHIISHGDDASLQLGNAELNAESLEQNNLKVALWANSFAETGDILIYGCNLAETQAGQSLINDISSLTLADVAASTDLTGDASQGGDWALEFSVGQIESSVAVSAELQQEYQGTFATYNVTSLADSGSGSLREAITLANAAGGADTIEFGVAGTINLSSALDNIDSQISIDGSTAPGYAGEPLVVLDGGNLSGNGLKFTSNSDGSSVQGLAIVNFNGNGIQVDSGSDGNTITGNWIGTTGTGTTGDGNNNNGINVQGANTVIGGIGANDGNVITNNGNEGINLTGTGATGTLIQGNIIGLDPDGSTGSGNNDVGIAVLSGAHNTIIGGTTEEARNIISMNFEGIEINSNNNTIQGNYIGTDITGTLDRGNRSDDGIEIQNNATGNLIGGTEEGAGNLIAFNALDGVNIVNGSGNTVLGNDIHTNGDQQIDLAAGANSDQAAPVLVSAQTTGSEITISGSLNSTANSYFRIEFFGSNQTYLGFVNVATDGSGNATFDTTLTASVASGTLVTSNATKSDVTYSTYSDTSAYSSVVTAGNAGTAIWRDASTTPQTSDWDGTSFGSTTATAPSGDYRIMQGAEAPTRDEIIIIGVDESSEINGEIWDGSSWSVLPSGTLGSPLGTVSQNYWWSMDVAYEQQSGDAVMVWADGTELKSSVWDGSNWSVPVVVSDFGGSTPRQIQLAAQPNGDEMVMVVSDSNGDDAAWVWDGSSWTSQRSLDTSGGNLTSVYVGYEQQSGDALVTYAKSGDANVYYQIWDGSSWSAEAAVAPPGGVTSAANWVTLGSDPGSDRIVMGVVTNGGTAADIWLSVWNGTAWETSVQAETTATGSIYPNVAVAFESTSGQAIAAYGEDGSNTIKYRTWDSGSGWSNEQIGPDIGGEPNSLIFAADPISDQIMLSAQDANSHVNYVLWDGSGWGTATELGTSTTEVKNQPFLFLWDQVSSNVAPTDLVTTSTASGGVALNEDGGNDVYFVADDGGGLLGGLTAVTIEASFSISTPATGPTTLLSYADGANDEELGLFIQNDGTIIFGARAAATPFQLSTSQYTELFDGEKHHVAVSWDSSTGAVDFYIDGQHAESFTGYQTGQTITGGGELVFGQDQDSVLGGFATDNVFSGTLYDVRIFDDVRTVGEVAAGYDQTLVNTEPGMIANWTFNDLSTGGVITDAVSGNNLTEQHVVAGGFTGSVAEATLEVAENASNGTVVGTLSTIDPDTGDSFTYTLLDDDGGRFDINSVNGEITVENGSLLDFETATSHDITVRVTDAGGLTYDEIFTITVTDTNDVPVATGNTVIASEDMPLVIGPSDFNFTDVESDSLASVTITGLNLNGGTLTHSGGAVTVTNGMTITAAQLADLSFTSASNDSTDSSFTYTVNDAGLGVTSAVMNITVNAVNDVPVATGNTVIASEDVPLVIAPSDFNFTDVELDSLVSVTITGLNLNGGTLTHSAGAVTVTNGMTITAAQLADLSFTSASNDSTGSSFTYTVNDAGLGVTSAVMNITVNAVNDIPVATGNTVIASEDVPLVIAPGDFNFTDVELDSLVSVTITGLNLNGGTLTHSGGAVTVTNGMTITAAQLADLTFTSAANDSTNSSFTYTVNDAGLGVTSAVMNITVNAVNDVPVATGNTVIASEDVPLVIGPGDFNFTDVESDSLASVTITGLNLNGGTLTHSGGAVTVTNGMTITAAQLADLTFTSDSNDSTDSSFTYTVNDAGTGITSAVMNINVNAVNDVPIATGNTVIASEDVPLVIAPGDFNFTDVELDSLASVTITGLTLNGGTLTHSGGAVTVTNGMTITAAELADLTFTSASNDSTDSSFTYTVNDTGLGVTSAVMNITVNAVNDVPVATGNTVIASEDVPLVIAPGDFNFTDVESDSLASVTITGLTLNGGTLTHSSGAVTVTNGMTITAAQLADLTFTSAANDSTDSSFTYTVNDAGLGVTSAVMNITVNAVNDVPVATGNTVIASEDVPLVIASGDFNFTDVELDSLVSVTITGLNLNGGTLTHSGGAVTVTNGMTITAAQLADLSFTSASNDSTDSSFTYTVNDAGLGVTSAVMNITVNAVNDIPVATGNTVIASEDVLLVIAPGDFSFTDVELDSLVSVTITGLNLNGGTLTHSGGAVTVTNGMTITAAQLADLTFTSASNDSTDSSFTYTVNDAGLGITSAVMNITVNAVNDIPVATGNTVIASEDVPLVIAPGDFSFTDVELDSLISVTITGLNLNGGTLTHSGGAVTVTNGMTITAAELADLTFTSASNDSTDSSFTYTVNDAGLGITSAVMNITVNAVNDVPVATGNTVIASEDVPLVIAPGDFNFTDVELDSLASVTITGLNLNGGTLTHSAGAVTVTNGMTITAAELADLTFTSASNDSTDSSFTYTVNDAGTGVTSAVMNITVNAANDVPVATGNTVIASEDVPLVIGPGDFNYTDTESDSLASVTITGLNLNGGTLTHSGGAVTVTNGMTITAAQLADLTFTSAANDSTNSSFTYTVNDAGLGVTSAVMNITVNAVNDVPVATGNTVIASEDVPLVIAPGDFNFTDVELDSLVSVTITGLNLNGGTLTHSGGAVTVTNGMTITAAQLADLTFTSASNDSTDSSFTYTVNDAGLGVTSAVMNITVNAVNDIPVATGNTVIASEDVPLVIAPGDFSFTDVESDSLASVTITGLNLNGGTLTHSGGAVTVTNGMTITAAELADLTFTSALNDSTDSSFTYTVNDAGTGVTSAVMNITVNAVNDVPVATGNTVIASEDVPLVIGAFDFNFTDVESDSLASVTITGLNLNGGTLTHSGGAVTVTNGMTITTAQLVDLTFTSASNDSTDSSFTYTVNDAGLGVTSAVMNITVNAVNDVPVATGNTVIASEDVPLVIGVSDFNYTDTESDSLLSVTITGLNLNGGTLTHSAGAVNVTNGMTITAAELADLTFTSASNDSTYSSFTYTVNDAGTGISSAIMNITVNAVNDAPVATGNTVVTTENVPLVIGAGDFSFTDVESDSLASVTITGLNLNGGTLTHSGGTVTVTNGMTITAAQLADLTFTSALNDSTDSSFIYTVNDTSSGVTSAVMNIIVNAFNNQPVIGGVDTATITEDLDLLAGNLTAAGALTIADPDVGESSFVAGTVNGALGSLSIDAAGNWSYSADNSQVAIQSLRAGESVTDTLSVTTADGSTHDIVITIDGAAEAAPPPVVEPPVVEPPPEEEIPPPEEEVKVEAGSGEDEILEEITRLPQGSTPPVPERDESDAVKADEPEGETVNFGPAADKRVPGVAPQPQVLQAQNLNVDSLSLQVSDDEALNEQYELELLNRIDSMHLGMDSDGARQSADDVNVQIVVGSTASLTVGIVSWVLRGGALLASFMSTVPLLNKFDPLPIIKAREDEEDVQSDEDTDIETSEHARKVDNMFAGKGGKRS